MPPKVPLPSDADLPEDARNMLAGLPPLNVFRMLGNAPRSMRPFLELGGSLLAAGDFDPAMREIAILRVARATGADYEWAQHEQLARNLGVGDEQIDAVRVTGPVSGLDEEGNLVCRVADEISEGVRLSDEALESLLERYGTRGATTLILCISYYNMVSRFLESTRVEIEPEGLLGGETPEGIVERGSGGGAGGG